jgi:hypothetical protein
MFAFYSLILIFFLTIIISVFNIFEEENMKGITTYEKNRIRVANIAENFQLDLTAISTID